MQETAISIGHCVWERESVLNHRGRTSKQARAEQPALLLPSPSRFSAPSRPSPRGSSSGSTVSFTRSTGVLRPDIGPNSLERQDYPVNNAPNLPPRSISLLLLRNFLVADRLQPCSSLLPLLFFSLLPLSLPASPHPSIPLSSPSRERNNSFACVLEMGEVFYLAFVSPGRRHALPRVRGVTPLRSTER